MTDNHKGQIKLWAVRVFLIALILLWMSTIFGFSAENGEQSQSLSDKITVQVVHILNADYEQMDIARQQEYFDTISFIVRKIGHFGEYGILGVLLAGLMLTFERLRTYKKICMVSTFAGMIYACTDEYHQSFVDGRSPQIRDVCIDTAGCFVGAVFLVIIWLLIARRKRKNVGK